jgi:NhaA family Na+:H+ antiporter
MGFSLRFFRSLRQFSSAEAASSGVLFMATIAALILSNSSLAEGYFRFWGHEIFFTIGSFPLRLTASHIVNDGLMAFFFFVVGLEIKRELVSGELSNLRTAALPMYAAVGGMIVPAAIYAFTNAGLPSFSGWGIPMATDIAFVLGVVTILGKRIPTPVRIFLLALAIVDDIGAVIVIAVFYTRSIEVLPLIISVVIMVTLFLGNRRGIQGLGFYTLLGICLWVAFLYAGIHATLAGVVTALLVPAAGSAGKRSTPLRRFEQMLQAPVAFIIMPFFAFANAGVRISCGSLGLLGENVSLGILVGLVIGKPLGISLFSWLSCKFHLASFPKDIRFRTLAMASILGGIGFTMSLFIANLSLPGGELIDQSKIAVLCGSVLSALIGIILFRIFPGRKESVLKP